MSRTNSVISCASWLSGMLIPPIAIVMSLPPVRMPCALKALAYAHARRHAHGSARELLDQHEVVREHRPRLLGDGLQHGVHDRSISPALSYRVATTAGAAVTRHMVRPRRGRKCGMCI